MLSKRLALALAGLLILASLAACAPLPAAFSKVNEPVTIQPPAQ